MHITSLFLSNIESRSYTGFETPLLLALTQQQTASQLAQQQHRANLVSQLQQKMENNIREAVDTVNQLIETTNQSMSAHYAERHRRLQEAYQQLVQDVQLESVAANMLLEQFIDNSSAIITSMQDYFDRVMTSTVERAFVDMNAMLTRAIAKIQAVCVDIVDKFKTAGNGLLELPAKERTASSMADVIALGLKQILQLAEKFKSDVDASVSSLTPLTPAPPTILQPLVVQPQPSAQLVQQPVQVVPQAVPVIVQQITPPEQLHTPEPPVLLFTEAPTTPAPQLEAQQQPVMIEPVVVATLPPQQPLESSVDLPLKVVSLVAQDTAGLDPASQQRTIELAKKILGTRNHYGLRRSPARNALAKRKASANNVAVRQPTLNSPPPPIPTSQSSLRQPNRQPKWA